MKSGFFSFIMKLTRLKSFYAECVRVFRITKKPTKEEYKAIVKVSGLGILLIGFIGFIIHVIDQLIKGL
ncbi:MAG: protein translocase SEC61 complex subunit gamma [Nanoarchaeota archaeon]|nr:protein translocase SEC61 complex subunit gamma [Nanoarchaeota archaeon]